MVRRAPNRPFLPVLLGVGTSRVRRAPNLPLVPLAMDNALKLARSVERLVALVVSINLHAFANVARGPTFAGNGSLALHGPELAPSFTHCRGRSSIMFLPLLSRLLGSIGLRNVKCRPKFALPDCERSSRQKRTGVHNSHALSEVHKPRRLLVTARRAPCC